MAVRHGVYVSEKAYGVSAPIVIPSGVAFVVGSAPVQAAANPAKPGIPVACGSWEDFVNAFGYSDDWYTYTLCEFAYSAFKLYGISPVIFCNVLDPATMYEFHGTDAMTVADHKVVLPLEAINDVNLVVKKADGTGDAYVKGTDYTVAYTDAGLVVTLIPTSTHYSETSLQLSYNVVTTPSVTNTVIANGFDNVERCVNTVNVIPDLLVAPGWSYDDTVAAKMTTVAKKFNGVFSAKAVLDISVEDATTAAEAVTLKETAGFTDSDQIVVWPSVKKGGKVFSGSTAVACTMARVDAANGCPAASPSNNRMEIDALVLSNGTEINQTKAEADALNYAGIVTAFNFLSSGWVCWGNYTAAMYSGSGASVQEYFIPISRMFDWVGNSLVTTFWSKLDKPLSRRLIDTIIDTASVWLNGLVGAGYLLGARVEFPEAENPVEKLLQGIITVHIYMTPTAPAQEINFTLEYDASYVTASLVGE